MKRNINFNPTCCIILAVLFLIAAPTVAAAGENRKRNAGLASKIGWSVFTRGGYVHQMDTDIDNGGSFSVNRFFVQGGPTHVSDAGTSISLAIGYGFDGYDFSGNSGFGGRKPWEDIHSLRFSIPLRWKINEQWTGFVSPALRFTGEKGADFGDSLNGGGFAAFSYRFSDRLSIGPGVGVLTQLEDSTRVIPILVINWKITDDLSLNTGRGTGATLGPGLTLDWRLSRAWLFSLGGRYERLRFRLDETGTVSNGIGEDRSFPIFGGIGYSFTPLVRISVLGGVEVGGELRLEDEKGHTIIKENHDPAGFLGVAFSARF
ncbi:MAG: TonB-dependent receptor [bacterium]